MLLLGTTDTPYEGDPAEVTATEDDIDTVLAEAAVAVDPAAAPEARALDLRRPCASCRAATVRPSTPAARPPSSSGKGGMLTVAGGKLTTYRRIALDALGRLSPDARARPASTVGRCRFRARPMRATSPRASSPAGSSSRSVAAHLAHFYGSRADRVVAPRGRAARAPRAAAPRCPGHRGSGRLRRAGGVGDERRRRRCTDAPPSPPAASPARRSSRRGSSELLGQPLRREQLVGSRPPLSDWIEPHTSNEGELTVATVEEPRTFIRPDGKEKVTGTGRYTADLVLAGPAHGEVPLRRPHARADHAHRRDEGARAPGRARRRHPRGRARRALRRHGQGPAAVREGTRCASRATSSPASRRRPPRSPSRRRR